MTVEQVRQMIKSQIGDSLTTKNDHGIDVKQALVPPVRITVIDRMVRDGRLKDHQMEVWLVAQENARDGYRIVMRNDGLMFGLASKGFPTDQYLVLAGWYRDFLQAFLGM